MADQSGAKFWGTLTAAVFALASMALLVALVVWVWSLVL